MANSHTQGSRVMEKTHKRVVVVGGGFGGLQVARALAADDRVSLSVVDRQNHHLFQPLLYQVATAGLAPDEISIPIRAVLAGAKQTEVFLAEAHSVALQEREVKLADGRVLPYDYLVLAAGARSNYLGHDDWKDEAHGLKNLRDALRLKERILLIFEQAEHEPDPARRRALLTFVVVGGGPTGVELAGAVAELTRSVLCRDFRHLVSEDIRVVLVEKDGRLLVPFEARLAAKARDALVARGVEVRLHTEVTGVGSGWAALGDERVECGLILWAPGVEPVPLAARLGLATHKGKVVVDTQCAVPDHPEVFVIGDMAQMTPQAAPGQKAAPLPGLAAVAMQQGKYVGLQIRRELSGKQRTPFRYHDRGIMATVGRAYALAQTKHLRMTGLVAWFAWIFVHTYLMIGYRNRLLVLYDWFWAYVTMKRGSRIITWHEPGHTEALSPEAEHTGTRRIPRLRAQGTEQAADVPARERTRG